MNKRIRYLTTSAMIAAMYVALSAVSQLLGLCSGNIQCRISEALCVLPVFTNAAVPGVAIGCLITNILFGLGPVDVALGTLATVIGAVVCYLLRKLPYIASVPTIISNALIIPVVLIYYQISEGYLISAGWVAIGEIIACGVLGTILVIWLKKSPKVTEKLFGQK